jgi:two-component system, cell cycle sensor histidine kinase and response regulator CckA
MAYRYFQGIRFKAVITIIIMITAFVSVMATYLIQTQTSLLKEEFKKRAIGLVENLARNCDYPVLLEDQRAIQNLSLAMLQNKDVVAITVENLSGRVLFQINNVKNPDDSLPKVRAVNPEKMHLETSDRLLYIALPVWAPHEEELSLNQSVPTDARLHLGRVIAKFSQDNTNALIRETIITTMVIAFAVVGITIVLLVFLLNRLIIPLLTLAQATRELSAGKLFHRVTIKRSDEIGELANAFNEMAENLENNRKLLEEYNQTLEEKIRERTDALRKSESRYRAFFESTGTAMVITEEGGTISLVNGEFENLFGMKREVLEGRRKWSEFIKKEDLDKMKQYESQRAEAPKSAPQNYEFQTININGQIKDIFVTVSFMPGTSKKISSLIDISEKKRLESGLRQAQKMEAVGTLAGGIAHDFNNMLMGIQGYASLMLFKMKKNDEHYEQLSKIEELVQSGSNLTRQILGFARGGKFEILPSNINDLIEKTSTMFGRTKKEIQIKKIFQEDIWTIDVDRGQIEQILLNLYVNAWHAMPGGGELNLETSNEYLTSDYNAAFDVTPGAYVKISVTDSGVGMDEKTKQRIFEPFFTTKEMGRGTGLGLAMVYGIMKGHKGIINVYSEKGQGTSFHLYFPVSEKEVAKEEVVEKTIERGIETILLVDDEETVLAVSKNMLSSMGYHIVTAHNGQEAVEIYKKGNQAIDLVILDMIMPGMSGGEAYDNLKALNPDIKVILCSGYSMNSQANQIIERGCRFFLQKPFSLYTLSQKVREALR